FPLSIDRSCDRSLYRNSNKFKKFREDRDTTHHRAHVAWRRLRRHSEFKMRFCSVTVSRLDRLIAALRGPAQAARQLGVHRSTLKRWRTGARPIPAYAATRMRELAIGINQELIRLAYDLQTDARKGRGSRCSRQRSSGECVA